MTTERPSGWTRSVQGVRRHRVGQGSIVHFDFGTFCFGLLRVRFFRVYTAFVGGRLHVFGNNLIAGWASGILSGPEQIGIDISACISHWASDFLFAGGASHRHAWRT
jgi:hypothetical protein